MKKTIRLDIIEEGKHASIFSEKSSKRKTEKNEVLPEAIRFSVGS